MANSIANQLLEFLKQHSLFSLLDDSSLSQLASRMEPVRYSLGETILNEGDTGQVAYLIFSGRVRILKRSESGRQVTLTTQSTGDVFGEQAILTDAPRSASVRASDDVVLFRISRSDFRSAVESNAELLGYFDKFMQERALRDFLATATVLKSLRPRDVTSLLDQLVTQDFDAGTTIFQEGDPASQLFIIRTGQVRIEQQTDSVTQVLRRLGAGEYFGEVALMSEQPRSATVVAELPTRCYTLGRDQFDALLETAPVLRQQLQRRFGTYETLDEAVEVPTVARTVRAAGIEVESSGPLTGNSSSPSAAADSTNQEPDVSDFASELDQSLRPSRGRRCLRAFTGPPFVPQYNASDCGPACLAMISRWYGRRLPVARLRRLADTQFHGTSLLNLSRAADSVGFRTRAIHSTIDQLPNEPLPAIAHLKSGHYVVVYRRELQLLVIGDPSRGVVGSPLEKFTADWSGRLLLLEPTLQLANEPDAPSDFQQAIRLLEPVRSLLIAALLVSLLIGCLLIASPLAVASLFESLTSDAGMPSFGDSRTAVLTDWRLGTLVAGVFAIPLGLFIRSSLLSRAAVAIHEQLILKLSQRLAGEPDRDQHSTQPGCVATQFEDARLVSHWLPDSATTAVTEIAMTTAAFVMIGRIHFESAVILFLIPFLTFSWLRVSAGALQFVTRKLVEQSGHSRDRITQWQLSRVAEPSPLNDELAAREAAELSRSALSAEQKLAELARLASNSAVAGALAGFPLLVLGARIAIENGNLTLPDCAAILLLAIPILLAVFRRVATEASSAVARTAFSRLNDLLSEHPPSVPPRAGSNEIPRDVPASAIRSLFNSPGRLVAESVSFAFHSDEPDVLTECGFEVEPGQLVLITGRSGSGKSTLLRLLNGTLQPTAGRILFGDRDTATLPRETRRGLTGTVTPAVPLLTMSVRDSIALRDPDAPFDRIIEAARLAGIDDVISQLPFGYDTLISSAEPRLSRAQLQSLGISRAILSDPPVLLLDDPFAALDAEQERRVWRHLRAAFRDRILIVASSRPATFQDADQILVLDQGSIVERGLHADLMARDGLYRYLSQSPRQSPSQV